MASTVIVEREIGGIMVVLPLAGESRKVYTKSAARHFELLGMTTNRWAVPPYMPL
jgi:hypothetical protein